MIVFVKVKRVGIVEAVDSIVSVACRVFNHITFRVGGQADYIVASARVDCDERAAIVNRVIICAARNGDYYARIGNCIGAALSVNRRAVNGIFDCIGFVATCNRFCDRVDLGVHSRKFRRADGFGRFETVGEFLRPIPPVI